jgi:hypothetical protein
MFQFLSSLPKMGWDPLMPAGTPIVQEEDMRKLAAAVPVLIAVAAGVVCLASSNAAAQDGEHRYRPYEAGPGSDDGKPPHPYDGKPGCFDLVTATGLGYPMGLYSKHSAIKAWKRQVWATYGRDFDWYSAADRAIECAPYRLTIRCMAAGRPCS